MTLAVHLTQYWLPVFSLSDLITNFPLKASPRKIIPLNTQDLTKMTRVFLLLELYEGEVEILFAVTMDYHKLIVWNSRWKQIQTGIQRDIARFLASGASSAWDLRKR